MQQTNPVYVTTPSLAPYSEYTAILETAWNSGVLTHNGPLLQELEKKLCEKFNIKNLVAVTNGTIALQLAIKTLKLKGEIITTPFSWIATCSAIQWEGCKPVFADIDPDTFNIDVKTIEGLITKHTVGIMPVHVFSNPCDTVTIEAIAKKHNLKVIYDAAHAVGVDYLGKSLLEWGDISATSFHATKLFNTGEGGACVTNNQALSECLTRLRFFGHDDTKEIVDEGLNGKMTEIHAAVGLANFPYIDEVINKRKQIYSAYRANLSGCNNIAFQKIDEQSYNYSYMPVVFSSETLLLKVLQELSQNNVFARRYFCPSLNTIKAITPFVECPVSEKLSNHIICLPSYHSLSIEKVDQICTILSKIL